MQLPVRTVHWGTGAMGSRCIAAALQDPRFQVVGVISTRSTDRARQVVSECEAEDSDEIRVGSVLADVVGGRGDADVVVLATNARVLDLEEQIAQACALGLHVVCIGEESLHPFSADPEVAQRLNDVAVRNAAVVVGTGANPGFMMDALPLLLTAPTRRWSRLYVRRLSDLSSYGGSVLKALGIGLSLADFDAAHRAGTVAGHLGFEQSIAVLADGLGIGLEIDEMAVEPILRDVATPLAAERIGPGLVVGVSQRCVARSQAGHTVVLEHPQRIGTLPTDEEAFGDLIQIDGEPRVSFRVEPGIDGGAATVALMLNLIPGLDSLRPGLHPTSDVPIGPLGAARETLIDAAHPPGVRTP